MYNFIFIRIGFDRKWIYFSQNDTFNSFASMINKDHGYRVSPRPSDYQ